MTSRPIWPASPSSTRRPKPGLASRSGDTSSTSIATGAQIVLDAGPLVDVDEFSVAARSPARLAAATWSRINDSSGDTTSVGPAPSARRIAVAAQYTADFPQPVACTTRTRALGSHSAATAVS